MKCPSCGEEGLPQNSKYCILCGSPVKIVETVERKGEWVYTYYIGVEGGNFGRIGEASGSEIHLLGPAKGFTFAKHFMNIRRLTELFWYEEKEEVIDGVGRVVKETHILKRVYKEHSGEVFGADEGCTVEGQNSTLRPPHSRELQVSERGLDDPIIQFQHLPGSGE